MRPPPSPTITDREKRSSRMNENPSLISRNVDVHSNLRPPLRGGRGIGRRMTMAAEAT
jgi:hypothetical protein